MAGDDERRNACPNCGGKHQLRHCPMTGRVADTFRDRARALAIEKNNECSEFMRRARVLGIDNKERQRLERCAAIYNAQALGVLLAIDLYEKVS